MPETSIDRLAIDTMRTLAIDAVQAANSGHPGAPMALSPLGFTLWNKVLRFDPKHTRWPNRDRFLLSNGHASMLQWALLHLSGTQQPGADDEPNGQLAVSLDDIKHFRLLHSKAPGHPEYGHVAGVEATTGPLGQGVGNSVGMAIAERWLAARYNRAGYTLFDYSTYAICGDGCMMEGISSEAASLAGHLALARLCWIYDCNRITIDGSTDITFTEDVAARFKAYGWNVLEVDDANDSAAIERALQSFKSSLDKPTFILLRSHIGYGSPHKQDTAAAHGEPLGEEEVKLTKRAYGWPEDAKFLVPDGVRERFDEGVGAHGAAAYKDWTVLLAKYRAEYPAEAKELDRLLAGELPDGWDSGLPSFPADAKGLAGREASGKVLNVLAQNIPWLIGGSADLESSTKVALKYEGAGSQQVATPSGKNIHFGIREHAMGGTMNGLALSKLRPFGSTFFVFSDYLRPTIRLAALMQLPNLYVFTHDALGDGEDGPTHQPIEQLASLRAMPGLTLIRPGDANEVVEAYRVALPLRDRPVALVLSRQVVPTLDRSRLAAASGLAQGAYVLADAADGAPEIILIGTGAELGLAVAAYDALSAKGTRARVVSMPSWDLFEQQPQAYRDSVLPPGVTKRLAVEQASAFGWERYLGSAGEIVCMHGYGASAPFNALQKEFGFTAERVIAAAERLLGKEA